MPTSIDDYFDALSRLKANRPRVVPKGSRISNDTVAIEAGRSKGAIRRSRPIFSELIVAIRAAREEQSQPKLIQANRLERALAEASEYRALYEEAIAREISLLREVENLKKKLPRVQAIHRNP